jgi:hypothetical protein
VLAALDPRRALRVARSVDAIRRAVAESGAKREVTT